MMAILAVQAIRKMRGTSQAHLMLCADNGFWVTKSQTNPDHPLVPVNEWIITRIAEAVGLSVPEPGIIEVNPWLAANCRDLDIEYGCGCRERRQPGLHFGSRFLGGLDSGETMDYLPELQLQEVVNRREFFGMLALDKWTGNCGDRQAIFSRRPNQRRYRASFIDHGACFNGGEWNFRDIPEEGLFARNSVYAQISGWECFHPWLERLETFAPQTLWSIAESAPTEWYVDRAAIERLIELLIRRRSRIRGLIVASLSRDGASFPLWSDVQMQAENNHGKGGEAHFLEV